uniref:Uncharacterized protein n=1 Tax=Daphnia galeata TaxID=27404 RepID=A0A8J2WPJ1_9CRUS|nr:unnamed protein product [Daphnia galeata]
MKSNLNLNLLIEFIRSAEFDRLMNDPLRACASYPLKVKTAALLLILRLVVWDRWGCVIPLIELWQTAKQIATLTSVKNHDWAATFHRVTIGNLEEYVPSDSRQEFVCRFMPDLVNGSRTSYKRAFDQLMDTWSSNLTLPSADYQFIFDCLGDPLNETRRQTLLSQRLWSQLVRGFGGDVLPVESVNVTVTEDDESEMDSKDH